MRKKELLILAIIFALVFVSMQCTKKEREHTGDAVNNAFNATADVLKDVAEGVNNAVYQK